MADLLIKNMKMPDCCYGCPLVYDMGEGNYACPFFNGYAPIDGRRDDCPLVEVSGSPISKDEVLACISKRKDFAVKVNDEICADLCDLLTGDINGLVEANNGSDN